MRIGKRTWGGRAGTGRLSSVSWDHYVPTLYDRHESTATADDLGSDSGTPRFDTETKFLAIYPRPLIALNAPLVSLARRLRLGCRCGVWVAERVLDGSFWPAASPQSNVAIFHGNQTVGSITTPSSRFCALFCFCFCLTPLDKRPTADDHHHLPDIDVGVVFYLRCCDR